MTYSNDLMKQLSICGWSSKCHIICWKRFFKTVYRKILSFLQYVPNIEKNITLIGIAQGCQMSWEQAFPIGVRMPWMSLKLSFLLTIILVLAVGFGHKTWVGFFSDSLDIIKQFTSMISLLLISIFIDSVQGVISGMNLTILYTTSFQLYILSFSAIDFDTAGVARGCGWQHLAVYVNFANIHMNFEKKVLGLGRSINLNKLLGSKHLGLNI